MINRILALPLSLLILILAACGGPGVPTDPPAQPSATPYQLSKDKSVDALITNFNINVRKYLAEQRYTSEEPAIYSTSLSPADLTQYYDGQLLNDGWTVVPSGLTNSENRVLLSYQKGNALFIVTAIDSSAYLGQGVVVYTIKATK